MSAYIRHVWYVLESLAPWLLLGTLIAGVLHVFVPADFVNRHLGRRRLADVVKAALLGVPMPLCSCGVIPTAVGLKKDGASDGASIAFLISTPQTGVDSIAVSAAFLGWPFALFKVISAFVTGLLGGVLANLVGDGTAEAGPTPGATGRRSTRQPLSLTRSVREVFTFGFGDLLYGIWKWLVLGIALSALISVLIPAGSLSDKAWATGWLGMLAMLAVSLPMYVCATGSVPIAAALVSAGMSPGAALVFLMAGPATNVATLGAVYQTFGKRILGVYLSVLIVGSLLLGSLFDFVLAKPEAAQQAEAMASHSPSALTALLGGALVLLLAWYAAGDLWRHWVGRSGTPDGSVEQMVLTVKGMSCQNCVRHVTQALEQLTAVSRAVVQLETGVVTVHGQGLEREALARAVSNAGYEVQR